MKKIILTISLVLGLISSTKPATLENKQLVEKSIAVSGSESSPGGFGV
ncbi:MULTISPECIES: hypothetical protein [Bacillus cereus group]|nr:hypothetical protein [Bacillus thuringiensis]EKS8371175.1 hypothetical protein [Bacillus cereus]MED3389103.1 hypothetical protein [Bacillus thuringiensis]